MTEPFINVIIPTFNRSQELKRALKSVFVQDYPYFDVWVIDDGSTDKTSLVIEEFSTKKNLFELGNFKQVYDPPEKLEQSSFVVLSKF